MSSMAALRISLKTASRAGEAESGMDGKVVNCAWWSEVSWVVKDEKKAALAVTACAAWEAAAARGAGEGVEELAAVDWVEWTMDTWRLRRAAVV